MALRLQQSASRDPFSRIFVTVLSEAFAIQTDAPSKARAHGKFPAGNSPERSAIASQQLRYIVRRSVGDPNVSSVECNPFRLPPNRERPKCNSINSRNFVTVLSK